MMILGMDFKFRDDLVENKADTVPIELTSGPYSGIVYRYNKVNVKVDTDKDLAVMKFGYDIIHTPNTFSLKQLKKDKSFEKHIGVILNTLIIEISEVTKNSGDTSSADRKDYSEELTD